MNEQEQARYWRERLMKLSREELSTLTGYSAAAIYLLETADARINTSAWQRYKNACLAVQLMRGHGVVTRDWKWGKE
jgi:hypothetical protein